MPKIQIKRGSIDPTSTHLPSAGELAVNTQDKKFFIKTDSTTTAPVWMGAEILNSSINWSDTNLTKQLVTGAATRDRIRTAPELLFNSTGTIGASFGIYSLNGYMWNFANSEINFNNSTLKNAPTPMFDGDVANKKYVDNISTGIRFKAAVNNIMFEDGYGNATVPTYTQVVSGEYVRTLQTEVYTPDASTQPFYGYARFDVTPQNNDVTETLQGGVTITNFQIGATVKLGGVIIGKITNISPQYTSAVSEAVKIRNVTTTAITHAVGNVTITLDSKTPSTYTSTPSTTSITITNEGRGDTLTTTGSISVADIDYASVCTINSTTGQQTWSNFAIKPNDRVLVKVFSGSDAYKNGIYVVQTAGTIFVPSNILGATSANSKITGNDVVKLRGDTTNQNLFAQNSPSDIDPTTTNKGTCYPTTTGTDYGYNSSNGFWESGATAAGWTLVRATDFDIWNEIPGSVVYVKVGTSGKSNWVCLAEKDIIGGTWAAGSTYNELGNPSYGIGFGEFSTAGGMTTTYPLYSDGNNLGLNYMRPLTTDPMMGTYLTLDIRRHDQKTSSASAYTISDISSDTDVLDKPLYLGYDNTSGAQGYYLYPNPNSGSNIQELTTTDGTVTFTFAKGTGDNNIYADKVQNLLLQTNGPMKYNTATGCPTINGNLVVNGQAVASNFKFSEPVIASATTFYKSSGDVILVGQQINAITTTGTDGITATLRSNGNAFEYGFDLDDNFSTNTSAEYPIVTSVTSNSFTLDKPLQPYPAPADVSISGVSVYNTINISTTAPTSNNYTVTSNTTMKTGDPVVLNTSIGGTFFSGVLYYIIRNSNTSISFASSYTNAIAGTKISSTVAASASTTAITYQFTSTGHGLSNGQQVYYTSTGTPAGGHTNNLVYYVTGVSTNAFRLASTSAIAAGSTNGVSDLGILSSLPSGAHKVIKNIIPANTEALKVRTGKIIISSTTQPTLPVQLFNTANYVETGALNLTGKFLKLGTGTQRGTGTAQFAPAADQNRILANVQTSITYTIQSLNTTTSELTITPSGTKLPSGTAVKFTTSASFPGLTNNATYYVINVLDGSSNPTNVIKLALTKDDALNDDAISLTSNPASGTHQLTEESQLRAAELRFDTANGWQISKTPVGDNSSYEGSPSYFNLATQDGAETLSNKTLQSPVLGTPTSGNLANCSGLPISGLVGSTSTALGVGSIELGHASDTTISRHPSGGKIQVEGANIATEQYVLDNTGGAVYSSVSNASVRAITGTTVTYAHASGTSTITVTGGDLNTDFEGTFTTTGARLLVKNQATAGQNGIYTITTWTSNASYVLTRAADFDSSTESRAGGIVFVTSGTTLANTAWGVLLTSVITSAAWTAGPAGSPALVINWGQTSAPGAGTTYSAGNGLLLSGTTFSVNSATIPYLANDNTFTGSITLNTSGKSLTIGNSSAGLSVAAATTLSGATSLTGTTTLTNTGGLTLRQAATQDGIILNGRAGGTSSYAVTFTPTTLNASRTITVPDVTGTLITDANTSAITSVGTLSGLTVSKSSVNTATLTNTALTTNNSILVLHKSPTSGTDSSAYSEINLRYTPSGGSATDRFFGMKSGGSVYIASANGGATPLLEISNTGVLNINNGASLTSNSTAYSNQGELTLNYHMNVAASRGYKVNGSTVIDGSAVYVDMDCGTYS